MPSSETNARSADEGEETMNDIDGYLATVREDKRAVLEALRRTIKAVVPEAVESVAYGVAGFKYRGRPLIYLGAAKKHCALYGVNVEAHREAVAGYDASKGTVRFAPDKPPPESLVASLLRARMAEIDARE
jgi:uncharacterized protein YdhG (YjbR/CyaY superfamily)